MSLPKFTVFHFLKEGGIMKLFYTLICSSLFLVSTANAQSYLSKIPQYIKSGDTKELPVTMIYSYHAMQTEPQEYVEVYSAISKTTHETVTILARSSKVSKKVNALEIRLVSVVHPAIATQIKNLPMTYAMHGSTGEPGRLSLEASGLREMALKAASFILDNDLAQPVFVNSKGVGLASIYHSLRQNETLGIQSDLDKMLLEQFVSRRNYDGVIESENAAIAMDKDKELINTFRIELAVPIKTSSKEIKSIFQAIIDSI